METKENLISDWKKLRPTYANFCADGILVQSEWDKANPKIMYILKESYGDILDISGPMGPYGSCTSFWRKIKIWSYIITEILNNRTPSIDFIWDNKEIPNDNIAYVNIKKDTNRGEGDWVSEYEDIMKYAVNDKDLLIRQIEMINPKVIMCCATFDFLKIMYPEIFEISHNLFKLKDRYIISHSHPSYFKKSYEQEFKELTEALNFLKH